MATKRTGTSARKKLSQGQLLVAPGDALFVVSFMEQGTGKEIYSSPVNCAADIESIAAFKLPRWKDAREDTEEGKQKGRLLEPHSLRVTGKRIEVWIDPWIAGCVKSR